MSSESEDPALRRAQARLRVALAAADLGAFEWDSRTRVFKFDEVSRATIGLVEGKDELSPADVVACLNPEDRRAMDAEMRRIAASGESDFEFAYRWLKASSGQWVWLRSYGQVIERDAQGRPQWTIGMVQDITERKRVERALAAEQLLNQQIIKTSPIGIAIYSEDGACIAVNPAIARQVGATVAQMKAQNFHQISSWRTTGIYHMALETLTSGEPTSDLIHVRTTFNKEVWLGINFVALETEGGRQLMQMTNDLTEFKRTETARLEAQENYQHLFASSMDGILLSDPSQGTALAANPAACVMLGVSPGDIARLDRNRIVDTTDPRLGEAMAQRRLHGQVRGEMTFRRANGELFEVELSSTTHRDPDGRLVASTIFRDITERKNAQLELERLNTSLEERVQSRTRELAEAKARADEVNLELEGALDGLRRAQDELVRSEKMAALGALVAGVAHELNTPIGNALLVATTLSARQLEFEAAIAAGLRRSSLSAYTRDSRELSDALERNLHRAVELISGFKQIAVDQSSYQRRPFELSEVVQEIALAMGPAMRRAGVKLIDETPAGILFDSYPGPLGQVFINLVNNALTHAFEGGAAGSVRFAARLFAPSQVRILVSDDGRGIASENLKKIFDPFFTTKLGQGGSGLGLHIVYTLVTGLLGGRIEARSTAMHGCEFQIDLPLVAPTAAAESSAPHSSDEPRIA